MKNNTGIKNILKLVKTLQKEPLAQEEIQEQFNIKEKTFYKYLKFIKNANFDILKTNEKYSINKYSKNIKLSNYDTRLLANIMIISDNILSNENSNKIKNVINKILLTTDSNTYKQVEKNFKLYKKNNNYGAYKEKVNLFEKMLKKNTTVKVILKSKNSFLAKTYKITSIKNRVYFNFITEESKIKTIQADRIIDICPEYLIKTAATHKKETIFELYGKLAKTYILRDEEVIVDNFDKGIRISNSSKDKDILFKRLLRYDTLCKVIHPKSEKMKFKELIDNSLVNINGTE